VQITPFQALLMYVVWRVAADIVQSLKPPEKMEGAYAFFYKLTHRLIGDSKSVIRMLLAKQLIIDGIKNTESIHHVVGEVLLGEVPKV
jgi:hypothetical protein